MRTKYALLHNDRDAKWTRHEFVLERPLTTPGGVVTGYEQIYRCMETGVERRWGITAWRMEPE